MKSAVKFNSQSRSFSAKVKTLKVGVSHDWVWLSGRSWVKFLLLATEWGIKERSLYGIEGWSLFRGCFTTKPRLHEALNPGWNPG